jgi:hypothetical protein
MTGEQDVASSDAQQAPTDAIQDSTVQDTSALFDAIAMTEDALATTDAMDARMNARDAISGDARGADGGTCPAEMVLIAGRVCVDRWENSLLEVLAGGSTRPWSPYVSPGMTRVRAVSVGDVVPQGYISGAQAEGACREASKRLCSRAEWLSACQGSRGYTYPFGNAAMMGACNVGRTPHPLVSFYGRNDPSIFTYESMNNPGINQQPSSLARTGQYARCVTDTGLFDLYGNLHEWIAEADGTFKGGFYADTNTNGPGCLYTTTAHNFTYHDYSTGFRCCADPR